MSFLDNSSAAVAAALVAAAAAQATANAANTAAGTAQTTANTANVGVNAAWANAESRVGKDIGAVGFGAFIRCRMVSGTCASGATVAGSSLDEGIAGSVLAVGTWRNVGIGTATTGTTENDYHAFQRIA